MRDKIFAEILKLYPSRHDLDRKWKLVDAILALPVEGVEVIRECPDERCEWNKGESRILHSCNPCYKNGAVKHPLTVAEALEMFKGVLGVAKKVCKIGCMSTLCDDCWVGKTLLKSIVKLKEDLEQCKDTLGYRSKY